MLTLDQLWKDISFTPNESQERAIRRLDGPLFLTAGPGSGKTRVLLWRTLNLIVFRGVKPEQIFLSTFTEKAALQLREGLKSLLALVTNKTGQPFDLAKMALGTVHSICRQILADRRFSPEAKRPRTPYLMDELDQYFHLYNPRRWNDIVKAGGYESVEKANLEINTFLGKPSISRHVAVTNGMALFNRLSEECIKPSEAKRRTRSKEVHQLLDMYDYYLRGLAQSKSSFGSVDFSLLQQRALDLLSASPSSEGVYKYLIIDEYQDTNSVQEQLFFRLANGTKNICVVGDDDQALYRFRGATVENLVDFEERCKKYLGVKPTRIDLSTNYRSREPIVSFYTDFIKRCNWKKNDGKGYHRVQNKEIKPFRREKDVCVIASSPRAPEEVYAEIVSLVKKLIRKKKVEDPNQIAFLFPSLKNNTKVRGLKEALEDAGLKVYAPRAGRFLDLDEAKAVFGLLMLIFSKPRSEGPVSQGLKAFHVWMKECTDFAAELLEEDRQLSRFVDDKHTELRRIGSDYRALMKVAKREKWTLEMEFSSGMLEELAETNGLSFEARKTLDGPYLKRVIEQKKLAASPYPLKYILNRVTSLDWNILDLFYQLNGFAYFKNAYDMAETRKDEGPLCNLGIISQYLSRFMEQFASIITASYLEDQKFQKLFFHSYVYVLFRRQESEFEDADDPFPMGRIPFLTIHQAKGLEFPVVVLGSPRKNEWPTSQVEIIARKLTGKEGEPLERIVEFDNMRMFYVSLSRPKNLLVIPHYKGTGQVTSPPFKEMLEEKITCIPEFDVETLPAAGKEKEELGKSYSYTGDYLVYKKCPRQYMVFKKYGFVPSRSQTMFFGTLVHQTIEDLHHLFMLGRE